MATLLERTEKNEQEILALKAEVSDLEARINYRDQMDLVDHFRLTGLPPISATKEEATKMAIKILSKVNVICTAQDFTYCFVYRNKNNTGSAIVGKFSTTEKREEANKSFRAVAKTTAITWNKFAPVKENDPIGLRKLYLTSSLTKSTIALLNKAREHRGTTFEYVWETGCRILVRKAAGQPTIEIKSPQQLQRIIDQHAGN